MTVTVDWVSFDSTVGDPGLAWPTLDDLMVVVHALSLAGQKHSMASSVTVTSNGSPKTVVVLNNDNSPEEV